MTNTYQTNKINRKKCKHNTTRQIGHKGQIEQIEPIGQICQIEQIEQTNQID